MRCRERSPPGSWDGFLVSLLVVRRKRREVYGNQPLTAMGDSLLRNHVPFAAHVHGEHAFRAGFAAGRMLLLPGEREVRAGRKLMLLAVDCEHQRAAHHGDEVVRRMVMNGRGEAGRELEKEMTRALRRDTAESREPHDLHARNVRP